MILLAALVVLVTVFDSWSLLPILAFIITTKYRLRGFFVLVLSSIPGFLQHVVRLDLLPWSYRFIDLTGVAVAFHVALTTLRGGWFRDSNWNQVSKAFELSLILIGALSFSIILPRNFTVLWHGPFIFYYVAFLFGLWGIEVRDALRIISIIVATVTATYLVISWWTLEAIYFGVFSITSSGFTYYISTAFGAIVLKLFHSPGLLLSLFIHFWVGSFLAGVREQGILFKGYVNPFVPLVLLAVLGTTYSIAEGWWWGSPPPPLFGLTLFNDGIIWLLVGFSIRHGVLLAAAISLSNAIVYFYSGYSQIFEGLHLFKILVLDELFSTAMLVLIGQELAEVILKPEVRKALHKKSIFFIPLSTEVEDYSEEEWRRQHDEVSNTLRRVMITLIVYSLFCIVTLATPDAPLLGVDSKIGLPIAGVLVDYNIFLAVGPMVLLGISAYLHIFLQALINLGQPTKSLPLPYIFNMRNPVSNLLTNLLFYILPVAVVAGFAWKALPLPGANGILIGLSGIVAGAMAYLRCGRETQCSHLLWIGKIVIILSVTIVACSATPGFVFSRPLQLDGTDLSGQNLSKRILKNASIRNADLSNARLKGSDLSGADLSDSELRDADFALADISNTVGLTCDQLRKAINVDLAFRDDKLECGLPRMILVNQGRSKLVAIGKQSITAGEFKEYMRTRDRQASSSQMNGSAISHAEALSYIEWLSNNSDGYEYRLPTQDEWTKAYKTKSIIVKSDSDEWLGLCAKSQCRAIHAPETEEKKKESEPKILKIKQLEGKKEEPEVKWIDTSVELHFRVVRNVSK